jgi:hypothetical protein
MTGRSRPFALLGLWGAACASAPSSGPVPGRDEGRASATEFHGWPAMAVANRHLEVVAVPAIGRIMQIGFAGDAGASDPLWRHGALGPALVPDENGWVNYGGDKAWPAPQADWEGMAGKGWPPPATFDARAHTGSVAASGSAIEMVSAVDPAYGVRVRRTVRLLDDQLLVETAYEKIEGAPVRLAVWTITQLASPDRVFALLPEQSAFPGGHRSLLPAPPRDLRVEGRLLAISRHPAEKTMIANDAQSLLWVGPGRDLAIETVGSYVGSGAGWRPTDGSAPRVAGAHAQIYTSPDGAEPYVELELLGPLVDLGVGQRAMMSVRYRLLRREDADPLAEARRVFAPQLARSP